MKGTLEMFYYKPWRKLNFPQLKSIRFQSLETYKQSLTKNNIIYVK